MANFSKYFDEAVKHKSCGDFFHPGRTCTQAKLDLMPKLFSGSVKYFLPLLLIPSLAKFEWTKEFFVKQLMLAGKTVVSGFVPAMVVLCSFCGFYDHLKKHYYQFYGLPISLGILMGVIALPSYSINILASGGANHMIEFILEASKGTALYHVKTNVVLGTWLFMTLSSTIVYLFKTTPYRPFWLLHVPHDNSKKDEFNEFAAPRTDFYSWMDYIVKRSRDGKRTCKHPEATCEGFLWQVSFYISRIINRNLNNN